MLMGNKVKVAIDTNVLLDVLLETRPGHHLAQQVISAAEAGLFKAQISTQSILDAAYSARKGGVEYPTFKNILNGLRSFVEITAIDWLDLSWATEHYTGDLEDDAQYASAYNACCDYFITRDKALFCHNSPDNPMTVLTPEDFIASMTD